MAANLMNRNGRDAFAYDLQTPWHQAGTKMGAGADVDTALDAADLRYTVGAVPLYYGDGSPVKGYKLAGRLDANGAMEAPFRPVGEAYTFSQNEANAEIMRQLVAQGCSIAAAGALGSGERAWMLAKMPHTPIQVLGADEVRGYFLLHWAHDGQSGVVGQFTMIRVVCQNTLAAAQAAGRGKKGNTFSIKHTSSVDAEVKQAAAIMAQLQATLTATGETFEQMARRPLGPEAVARYIEACIPNPEPKKVLSPVLQARRDTIARLMVAGRGAELANSAVPAGTISLWAAYNGVTEYFDHVRTAEAKSDAGRQRAVESAIFGGNAEVKVQALELARELVAV